MLHELVEQARTMQVQGIEKVKKLHEEVVKREKEKGDAKEHFHNLVAEKEVCNHLLRNCLTLLSRAHETRTQARAGRLHARAPSPAFPCNRTPNFGRPWRTKRMT